MCGKIDDALLDELISGDFDNLIAAPKRLVRLFISSTFTDMTLERNSLMERVYPRLKTYCRERHGLDFQGKALARLMAHIMKKLDNIKAPSGRHALGCSR